MTALDEPVPMQEGIEVANFSESFLKQITEAAEAYGQQRAAVELEKFESARAGIMRAAQVDRLQRDSLVPPSPSEIRTQIENRFALNFIRRIVSHLTQIGSEPRGMDSDYDSTSTPDRAAPRVTAGAMGDVSERKQMPPGSVQLVDAVDAVVETALMPEGTLVKIGGEVFELRGDGKLGAHRSAFDRAGFRLIKQYGGKTVRAVRE